VIRFRPVDIEMRVESALQYPSQDSFELVAAWYQEIRGFEKNIDALIRYVAIVDCRCDTSSSFHIGCRGNCGVWWDTMWCICRCSRLCFYCILLYLKYYFGA
jgi:hypothetical protein